MLNPKLLATLGGALISLSGIVSILLGIKIKALVYDVYPGGKMGHIGILAGVAAVLIGLIIVLGLVPLYDALETTPLVLGAILTIVLGHIGAVAGAIYVGTAGVILCYIAGIWQLINIIRLALQGV
jgi:hypothetical protein